MRSTGDLIASGISGAVRGSIRVDDGTKHQRPTLGTGRTAPRPQKLHMLRVTRGPPAERRTVSLCRPIRDVGDGSIPCRHCRAATTDRLGAAPPGNPRAGPGLGRNQNRFKRLASSLQMENQRLDDEDSSETKTFQPACRHWLVKPMRVVCCVPERVWVVLDLNLV